MSTLSVSLPEDLRLFLEGRAKVRGMDSAATYLLTLAVKDRDCEAKSRLETHLLASLDSGTPIEVTDAYWDEVLEGQRNGEGHDHP